MTKKKPAPRPTNLSQHPPAVSIDLTATERAWSHVEARARALPAAQVSAARVDITQAAAIATAAARNVLDQRELITELFHDAPFSVFERIAELALAAQHADLLHRASLDTESPFADILPRINELRGFFLDDLAAQVRRKKVPAKVLDDVRAGDNSVRDKANDLNDAASYYRTHWATLSKKTTIEPEEIAEAGELATKALARLGALHVTVASKAAEVSTSEMRRRAFTVLEEDYEVVRRFGSFLFWEYPGGWEEYTPSLYAGRAPGEPTKPESVTPTPPSGPQ